jgi:hypothetical protein
MAILENEKISVGVSQDEFMNTLQLWRQSMTSPITVPARVTWRNQRTEVVSALTSAFTVTVTGNGDGVECLDATLLKVNSAQNKIVAVPEVVAGEDIVFTSIEIKETLKVEGDTDGCSPTFLIYMKDNDNAFKSIEEMKEILTDVVS